jgi:hypothetical protein
MRREFSRFGCFAGLRKLPEVDVGRLAVPQGAMVPAWVRRPSTCRPATSCAGRLRRAIRVDRVSNEDADTEQAENRGKSLNHLTHPYCTIGNV